ncbi:MAG: hypothetical protein ABIR96_06105 [Bdellovibrionota bacterium]
MAIKKHFPWMIFALVLMLSLGILETHGLDTKAREVAEITETKSAWIEKQTQAMDMKDLGQFSNLQKVLEVTRNPGSVKELN